MKRKNDDMTKKMIVYQSEKYNSSFCRLTINLSRNWVFPCVVISKTIFHLFLLWRRRSLCGVVVWVLLYVLHKARVSFSAFIWVYTTQCARSSQFITDMSAQHKYSFRLTMMTGWFIKSTELLNNINDIWFQFIVEVGMYLLQGTKPQ